MATALVTACHISPPKGDKRLSYPYTFFLFVKLPCLVPSANLMCYFNSISSFDFVQSLWNQWLANKRKRKHIDSCYPVFIMLCTKVVYFFLHAGSFRLTTESPGEAHDIEFSDKDNFRESFHLYF